jgi:hypothetical protein
MAEGVEQRDKGNDQRSSQRPARWLGGCSALGLLGTGVTALAVVGYLSFKEYMSLSNTDSIGIALALMASALAFGFLSNAIYRR